MFFEYFKQWSSVITAVVFILGIAGYIAKPHAEQFVRDAVQDKVDTLDIKLRHVERILKENTDSQKNITTEQKILLEKQNLIIDLLRKDRENIQ